MAAERWTGLGRIDRELGLPKGAAFRAFKQLAPHWREGDDFRVLHHQRDAGEIAALKQRGEIHSGSVNAVVLAPPAADALRRQLRGAARPR